MIDFIEKFSVVQWLLLPRALLPHSIPSLVPNAALISSSWAFKPPSHNPNPPVIPAENTPLPPFPSEHGTATPTPGEYDAHSAIVANNDCKPQFAHPPEQVSTLARRDRPRIAPLGEDNQDAATLCFDSQEAVWPRLNHLEIAPLRPSGRPC